MDNQKRTLADIGEGEDCIIVKVNGHGGFRHRVMEMGFVKGERVMVLKNAPLQDPIEYKIMQSHVSLRRSEASHIEVINVSDQQDEESTGFNGTFSEEIQNRIKEKTKTITVALVGNPNCGKTSFFNHATGLREHVGNYSGVTVSSKVGTFYHNGYTINLVDLPGTYSITEYSPEELYVREYITEQHPDVVLNIVDSSNLERNLFLTTQLIDMNVRMVMALNMYDELEGKGLKLDDAQLEKMLGFPCAPTNSKSGKGIDHVLDHIITVYEETDEVTKHIHINYGAELEHAIGEIKSLLTGHSEVAVDFPFRYVALKLLEGDKATYEHLERHLHDISKIKETTERCRSEIEREFGEDAVSVITNAKYGFIRGALAETIIKTEDNDQELAYAIDKILTNKWLGFPVLILFLWIMFQTTFTLGAYPQEWIESGVNWLSETMRTLLGEGILSDLIVDGIIAGVGGVIVFLPNILILFFFISLLEDTGYMARAAFIMDKLMHKMGLHGKSFIPLLTGFGCGVPAIMSTRTLENPKDRIVTMMAIPFMSCSARLPVYLLFVAAFFAKNQGLILLSIYLLGIIMAIITALLLKKTVFKGDSEQFVMELPPYRIPSARNTLIHMWEKAVQYLKKMGSVILVASIIIWALCYFPTRNNETDRIDEQLTQIDASSDLTEEEKEEQRTQLEIDRAAAQSENSYLGKIGKFIEPAIHPLGFNWKMGVSILTGAAAKEIVVSSMGILYHADQEADEESEKLITALRSPQGNDKPITPLVAYGFMAFILLYFPCIASLTAVAKEANWKWMVFSILYTTSVAWIVSFLIYQIGSMF
ncbi:MAG: ferrous iron transport protein B [Paludibacteraceae bacterium]|nr:ferrous iron transport protein B [Paludibacteraceae bacterium]